MISDERLATAVLACAEAGSSLRIHDILKALLTEAIEEEREACAKVADKYPGVYGNSPGKWQCQSVLGDCNDSLSCEYAGKCLAVAAAPTEPSPAQENKMQCVYASGCHDPDKCMFRCAGLDDPTEAFTFPLPNDAPSSGSLPNT